MNNPLEAILRRQKAAQGGRMGFFGGGGADMGAKDRATEREARGYGAKGSGSFGAGGNNKNNNNNNTGGGTHGGQDPQAISAAQIASVSVPQAQSYGIKPNESTNVFNNFNVTQNPLANKIANLYDRTGLTVQDIAQQYGIPNLPPDEGGILGFGKKAAYNIFSNPLTAVLTGSPLSLFGSIVFGKGPYTQQSLTQGLADPEGFANLYNAPTQYVNAVKDIMGDAYEGSVQQQQAEQGLQDRLDARGGNRPDKVLTEEEKKAMEMANIDSYKATLTEQQRNVYNRLQEQNYSDEYIRAYLGFL